MNDTSQLRREGRAVMRVALVSLDQAWEDRDENLRRCRARVQRSAAHGADLVVLPEMTLTAFSMNATSLVEDAADSPTVRAFSALALEHRVAIAFGVVLQGDDRPLNCLVVIGRDGTELGRYAKIHPFTQAREHLHYEAGTQLAVAMIGDVSCGLTICYDLRFPEVYAALAARSDAQIVIANWPETRIDHWHTLLAARAIDGQCYVIGVNRTGVDGNGFRYPRSSQVVGPRGERLVPVIVEDDIELFMIDARKVAAARRAFPTLRDRRPDLYARLQTGGASPADISIVHD